MAPPVTQLSPPLTYMDSLLASLLTVFKSVSLTPDINRMYSNKNLDPDICPLYAITNYTV